MKSFSYYSKFSTIFLLFFLVFLFSCAGWQVKIDQDKMKDINKVAVIMFTVPEKIEYRDDPKKKPPKDLLDVAIAVAQESSKGDGTKAATLSHKAFCDEFNKQGMRFTVLSQNELFRNDEFTALYIPPKEDKKGGLLGSVMSMFGGSASQKGRAPEKMNQYGLSHNSWDMETAIMGTKEEKEYIQKAINALKVDGIIVIHDTGYCFSCKGCAGPIGGPMTGVASTGSHFIMTLFNKKLDPVLSVKEYFCTTPGNAPMAANIILPTLHDKLFIEHGKKMAKVVADVIKGELGKTEEKNVANMSD